MSLSYFCYVSAVSLWHNKCLDVACSDLETQTVQLIHELIEMVLFCGLLAGLTPRDPDTESHGRAAVFHQFNVSLHRGQFNRARGTEKLGEVDLQSAGTF